jgi:uncharacterized protein YyaL (SSP411 family)
MVWSDYHQLYAYDVRYAQRQPDQIVTTDRYFGYDQAIAMQAWLVLYRMEPENTAYLSRARQLARATDRYFWQPELGGYTLEADVPDQYASYSVWISEAFIDLYRTDGDRYWLERARANFDQLEARFKHGESGAYYHRLFPCRDEFARFCAAGDRYGLDRTIYTLSQAMMQRVAALLAATP